MTTRHVEANWTPANLPYLLIPTTNQFQRCQTLLCYSPHPDSYCSAVDLHFKLDTMKNLSVKSVLLVGVLSVIVSVDEAAAFSSVAMGRVTSLSTASSTTFQARRRDDDYYDDDDYNDDGDGDEPPRRRRRRPRDYDDQDLDVPSSYGRQDGWRLPESVSKAVLAGVFVLGIGLGVTVDSAINTDPKDLASRDAVDQAAPNAKLCATMGASAMAFDQRVFVSFNPFNVFVAQADVKPACVLRASNVVPILRDKNLINDAEVRSCKSNMNTWAFVGDLSDSPQLSCVYKSEDAQNEFLSNPKFGIGEDYLDDDRAKSKDNSGKKMVKNEKTNGQKEEYLRQQARLVPGLD
jgi:hypothetical protein